MKRVKNLTENKDLINTFKKIKTKTHLNKSNIKKVFYYFHKYGKVVWFKKNFKNKFLEDVFFEKLKQKHKPIKLTYTYVTFFFKITTMFIN